MSNGLLNILIVDDEVQSVRGLQNIINWKELSIGDPLCAFSKKDAMEVLKNNHVDLLLTDIVLGDGTGLELIRWNNERKVDFVSIILSSYPNFRYAQEAIGLGVHSYLLKPVEDAMLLTTLRTAAKQAEAFLSNPKSFSNTLSNPLIHDVENYIHSHISEEISRSDIAEYVHLSPEYLSTYFSRETGFTLSNYIKDVRVECAKGLLEKTNLPISTISENVGYETLAYFSSVFRQKTGFTPRAYRKMVKFGQ